MRSRRPESPSDTFRLAAQIAAVLPLGGNAVIVERLDGAGIRNAVDQEVAGMVGADEEIATPRFRKNRLLKTRLACFYTVRAQVRDDFLLRNGVLQARILRDQELKDKADRSSASRPAISRRTPSIKTCALFP